MTETPAWLSAWRGANPERAAEADERGHALAQAFAEARAAAAARAAEAAARVAARAAEAKARASAATVTAARQPPKPSYPRGYKHPKPTVPYAEHMTGFQEPEPWPFDGCKRREPVLDRDFRPARVVRVVGWNLCLRCQRPFFSPDVRGIRMCPACKSSVSE